jgi:hypothetical protein
MVSITPCHGLVSDRFPVASFVVQVPPERLFEIACATDPSLFHAEQRHRRTQNNFFTTRAKGLLRAPGGQATYLLPPEQLRRFAGMRRLYYAVGSYTGPRGENPSFTTPLEAPQATPSIQISPDFTGKSLDRSRLRGRAAEADARYGAAPPTLTWGGDLAARNQVNQQAYGAVAAYNDGHSPELWAQRPEPRGQEAFGGQTARDGAIDEPLGYEDAPGMARQGRSGDSVQFGSSSASASSSYDGSVRRETRFESSLHHESYGGATGARAATSTQSRSAPAPRKAPSPQPRAAFGRVGAGRGGEPPGFEDAPALARSGHALSRTRYGEGTPMPDMPAAPPVPTPPPLLQAVPGRDDSYDEDEPEEAELPADLPDAGVSAPSGVPLTIPEKFKIVLVVANAESGAELYSAINPDGEYNDPRHPAYQRYHIGLSWGIIQFTQRGGALGSVLQACQERDADRFRAVFGDATDELLSVVTAPTEDARVQPVAGSFLWQEPWLARFREAGAVPAFQAAQNQVAIEGYFDPNVQFASWLGLKTDRALAMLYDRCVNMGNGAGRSFVAQAVGPIRTQRQRNAALAALGKSDLRSFQQSVPGLTDDGVWGPLSHAALCGALSRLGPSSPVALPSLSEMLDRMLEAAKGRRFEARLRTLRTSADLYDTIYEIA